MVLKKTGLAAAVLLAGTQFAYANDLQINGFINVTGGYSPDYKDGAFSIDGYDDGVSFDNGTLVGLQMSKKVNDTTSATVQLISRGGDGYETEASWAYVTFAASDNTDIRAGRLRTPFFYYSDFLEVGYAYNWIRPPSTVYRLDGLSSITGVDLTHRFNAGPLDGSVQVYAGRYNNDFTLDGDTYDLELRRAMGAVLNLSSGNFGTRLSYHKADLTIDNVLGGTRALDGLLGLAATVAGGGPAGADFANANFKPNEDQSEFLQASVSWDNGSTALIAEWTALKHETAALNDDNAWMLSAAQRFGDATVHLTYTTSGDDLKSGTIGTVQKFAEAEEANIILGLRYDYDSSAALKFEIQHSEQKSASGRVNTLNPNAALVEETGLLYTIGMSIVF